MALSPLFFFCLFYLSCGIISGDFYSTPITIAFMLTCIYAVLATRNASMEQRIEMLSKGAGQPNIMLMIWIFILAGAFAASAKQMGAIDATVNLAINALPGNMILAGIFLASCFISLSMGTSVGTIAALIPIAQGIASQTDIPLAMMVGIVVGGAYFGDNLSFISDTTIAATQTQGCRMGDKFRTNIRLVLPLALSMLVLYWWLGRGISVPQDIPAVNVWRIIPYLAVIITAVSGLNVMLVLLLGLLLTLVIGLLDGSYDLFGWMGALGSGINSMGELIIMAMLAAGMLETIRQMGGIDYLIRHLTRGIRSARGAQLAISALVCLVNICTANNTVAILTTGPIAHRIASQYGISPRRSASLLDTSSCFMQGLLPYSAQLLVAAGLVEATLGSPLNPASVVPFLFYPIGLGIILLLSILFSRTKQ